MAIYSGFFDGDDLYGQDEFNRYFDNIYRSGISVNEDGSMTLNCFTSGENVIVSKGFSIVKGFYMYSDADTTIAIDRDVNYNRIDRMIVKLNLSTKKVTLERKKGTAGSTPVAPTLQRDNIVHELSLCQIFVPRTGSIVVTDERANTNLCGAIRPKALSEIDTMINGFHEQFENWFNAQQAKGWRNVYIQSNEPTDSVVGSIWIKIE